MRTKSKSKTFAQQTEMYDITLWVMENIETEDREIPYGGAEPALDVKVETVHKYVVTITQFISNDVSNGKA